MKSFSKQILCSYTCLQLDTNIKPPHYECSAWFIKLATKYMHCKYSWWMNTYGCQSRTTLSASVSQLSGVFIFQCTQMVLFSNIWPKLLLQSHIPSTSDRAMSRSAFTSTARRAAKLSLSLMLINYGSRKLIMQAPKERKVASESWPAVIYPFEPLF